MEGEESGKEWLRKYLRRKSVAWPHVVAGQGWYEGPAEGFKVGYLSYVPLYLLVDADGRLIEANPPLADLGPRIERALAAGVSAASP